jgi:predicted N-acyltransferase
MGTKYRLKIHRAITDISSDDWNGLVTPDAVPFLEWEWLAALEESGSVSPETGWHPLHICLWDDKRLVAVAPLYLKTSSDGEYVYDYFWAEAAGSVGRPWYPKMTGTVAATPAEGYRFLAAPGTDLNAASVTFLEAAEAICRQNKIPSLNLLWADPAWGETLTDCGYFHWDHFHYLWENEGFSSFDDYLALFSKNQRKNIRKEYARHLEQGISVKVVPGEEAEEDHYRKMFELFSITNDKFMPWDARWVNEKFFLLLAERCRRRTAFAEARQDATGEILAMAFLVAKGDRLWGRYWGAYEEIRDLHFAVCYYAPMDFCIRNKIRYFDPGAGSPHKIRRGFKAVRNRSWHKLFDPVLERLFRDNIKAVNRHEATRREELNAELPYKKESPNKEL